MIIAGSRRPPGRKYDFAHYSISLYNELTHVPLIICDHGDPPRGAYRGSPGLYPALFRHCLTPLLRHDAYEERYSLAQGADPDRGVVFAEAITDENVLKIIRRQKPQLCGRISLRPAPSLWQTPYKLILTGEDYRELFNFVEDPRGDAKTRRGHACQGR